MSKVYLLSNIKFKNVINIPVLQINYLKQEVDLSTYDALLFTSKNAIYSLCSFDDTWKKIPSYAIAQKTADIIKLQGGKLEFIGKSSHGDDFAKELAPILKNKKVLYVRAKKVVSSLVTSLKNDNININELITYETACNENLQDIKIENNAVIIFSSPSTIKCFFKKYSWNKSYKAVVIGKTTAKYLPSDVDFTISPSTSLEKCIEVAQSL